MIKRFKVIPIILVIFSLTILRISYAQPKIPKKEISGSIPSDVKEEIERLYSDNPVERGRGAFRLGELGEKAVPAIPFLKGIQDDFTGLEWVPWAGIGYIGGDPTSPGQEAACALWKIEGEKAVDFLINSLQDEDSGIRGNAVAALGITRDKRAVEPLIFRLKDKKFEVRRRAAAALGLIKDKRAVELLITALKDEDSDVRDKTAIALGMIKDTRAVEPLVALVKEGLFINNHTIEALGEIGSPDAVNALLDIIQNKNKMYKNYSFERVWAVWALRNIGSAGVAPLLSALTDENDSGVRERAAEALGVIKDDRAVKGLIQALHDKDDQVREYAAWALGEIKDTPAVDPLIAALKDKNGYVVDMAARAFEEMKIKRAVGPLLQAINERGWIASSNELRIVLEHLTGEQDIYGQAAWQEWWQKNKEKCQ